MIQEAAGIVVPIAPGGKRGLMLADGTTSRHGAMSALHRVDLRLTVSLTENHEKRKRRGIVAEALQEQNIICSIKRYVLLFANEMMTKNDRKDRRIGAAAAFIEEKLAAGRIAFDLEELVGKTGLSKIAARNQLQRLRGRVVRVSRPHGFFLIVDPQHRAAGAPPVEWWLDEYFRWLGHPYYLALQSAAEIYNSAPQAIQVKQIVTDCPRRNISLGRLRLRFFVKKGVERTPVQQPPNAYALLRVSTPEATALDMVRYASRIGGMGRALETILPLLPLFRASELRRALDAEGEAGVAQRLGYLIETAGKSRLANIVHDWLPSRIVRVPLGSSKQVMAETEASRRWRILIPESGAWL